MILQPAIPLTCGCITFGPPCAARLLPYACCRPEIMNRLYLLVLWVVSGPIWMLATGFFTAMVPESAIVWWLGAGVALFSYFAWQMPKGELAREETYAKDHP